MSDPELIKLSLSGEPVAYDVLVERYRPRVEAVVAQFMRGADREDCVQETFLKGLISLPDLRDHAKFGAWLSTIARNICLDTIRKASPVFSIDGERPWETLRGMQMASPSPTPLKEFIRLEECIRLRAGMARLNEKYRAVLEMRYFEGSDYASIAQRVNKPLGTVKSLIHRGHKRLRELMADESIHGGSTVVN
jgi:RNA polymerase sigma-70 factor (ECF subfamily)